MGVLEVSISILICAHHQTRYHKRKFVRGLSDFDLISLDELYTFRIWLVLSHESADGWLILHLWLRWGQSVLLYLCDEQAFVMAVGPDIKNSRIYFCLET